MNAILQTIPLKVNGWVPRLPLLCHYNLHFALAKHRIGYFNYYTQENSDTAHISFHFIFSFFHLRFSSFSLIFIFFHNPGMMNSWQQSGARCRDSFWVYVGVVIMMASRSKCHTQVTNGYDYKFVDGELQQKYMCPICCCVACNPFQVTCCGSVYCESCFSQLKTRSKNDVKCPYCRANLTGRYFQDSRINREIQSLQIYCPNREEGCLEWKGELQHIGRHLDKCQYETVGCTNEQCSTKIQRHDLTKHLETCLYRQFECSYCQMKDTYLFIKGDHHKSCTELPIPCPITDCTRMIKRCDLDEHKKNCPHRLVDCEYKEIGCDSRVKYCNIKAHDDENISKHLALAVAIVSTQKQDIVELNNQLQSLKSDFTFSTANVSRVESIVSGLRRDLNRQSLMKMKPLKTQGDKNRSDISALTGEMKHLKYLNIQFESKINEKLSIIEYNYNQSMENFASLDYKVDTLRDEIFDSKIGIDHELDNIEKQFFFLRNELRKQTNTTVVLGMLLLVVFILLYALGHIIL